MIRAIVFDLDGTLVQTETIKAQSYAQAVLELAQGNVSEADAVKAFKAVVGRSRHEIAQYLLNEFGLEAAARERMDAYGVNTPWQAFVQIRMKIYAALLQDPLVIVKHRCPYSLDVLVWARENGYRTGLVTMSRCHQAGRVLQILDIADDFDFIASRDDVNTGKPDPEIYRLAVHELSVEPTEAVVLEDSEAGIQAALAAGLHCVAVTSDFTRQTVQAAALLERRWMVTRPAELKRTLKRFLKQWPNENH
jgi:beta-phosphoglucomutase